MNPIPFLKVRAPEPELVARDYADIVASGVFSNSGPVERRFAEALAQRIGNDAAVSVTANATSTIQLACRTLFEVGRPLALVASFTAVAGPLGLRWAGFEPLFIDIAPGSWQPDPARAAAALAVHGDEVAGILLTSTFGTANADIEAWEQLARDHRLPLVIDSAPGFGSSYPWGEPLGARGDCEIFSFHATKTIAIGEGGALASRDHALVEEIDQLKNFGFDAERVARGPGLNAKLPELASAIGLRQLDVLDERLERRRAVLRWYFDALGAIGCEFQRDVEHATPSFVSTLLPVGCARADVGDALTHSEIGWRAYFDRPVHRHPSFEEARTADLPVTEDVSARILSLPLDEELTTEDVKRIAEVIAGISGG